MDENGTKYIVYKYTELKQGSGQGFIFKIYFCEELACSIKNSVLFRKD